MVALTNPVINNVQNVQIEQDFVESLYSINLSLQDKKNWVALASVSGVGPVTFFQLLYFCRQTHSDWASFWAGKTRVWQQNVLYKKIESSIKNFKKEYTIESYWQMLIDKQIRVIALNDTEYPCLLKHVSFPPPVLFLKGRLSFNQQLPIAVIGSRHMTGYGRMVTNQIIPQLTANDVLIVSGFMYGVDLTAQQAALQAQGNCVGVLGYGFDHLYPAYLKDIYQQMLTSGQATFVSEYPPFVGASKGTFVRRNRIIAGMSAATLVIEAGVKSGTQITVNDALESGREVLAVSGPITSPYYQGTKAMINQGAQLVGSGQEVLQAVAATQWGNLIQKKYGQRAFTQAPQAKNEFSDRQTVPLDENSTLEAKVVEALRIAPASLVQLSALLQENNHATQQALTILELEGLVVCQNGQWMLVR